MPRSLNVDPWSYYDYKTAFSRDTVHAAPGWVDDLDRRRIRAYKLLSSYLRNNGREFLSQHATEADRLTRREYGDPETIRDQIHSSMLGDTQTITVLDAIGEEPDVAAASLLVSLNDWAQKEHLILKVMEAERHAIGLGDAVYVLGINDKVSRPKLRVFNPNCYFPVLDAAGDEEFPATVHIAYEFEKTVDGQKRTYLRRITWELVPVPEGEREALPWSDGPQTETVLYSDGTWLIGDYKGNVYDLDVSKGSYKVYQVDLEIDFIPVIHIPNLGGGEYHYGTSALARTMQIFDDLVSTDTDLQASSATTGSPPIAVNGASLPTDDQGKVSTYGPGTVWETGDGSATMIDTSSSLDALLKYDQHLLERMSVNGRIPESLLGRVKPNEVPSGIALTLSFTPHAGMIKEMRLLRQPKYGLLMKFVARFLMQLEDIPSGIIPPCNLAFGTFLPSDKQETANLVSTLLGVNAVSIETAVRMLVNAGLPIEDAAAEVQRIISEDFTAATELLEATGDPTVVRDRLGIAGLPPVATAPADDDDEPEDEDII